MAIYPPPSESPPVFNELDFIQIISTKFLDKNYLRLIAQSDEDMNLNQIRNMASGIDGTATESDNAATIGDIGGGGTGLFLRRNGTNHMTGDLDMANPTAFLTNSIHLVSDGVNATDATNKQQMDAAIAAAVGAIPLPYLPLAGGTMSGDIDMGTDNLLMDDTAVSLGSITGDIFGSGLGTATLVVDGNNTSFGTAQFTTTALSGAVDVSSFTGTQLRINGQYKFYLRNTSGQTITFKGNSTATWTGGMKCGTVADLVVANAREAVVEVDVWTAVFSVVRFYSIR